MLYQFSTTRVNYPLDTVGNIYYYLTMTETIRAIECENCGETTSTATAMNHEGMHFCSDCWPEYCEQNGVCETCGEDLKPIYENNGFQEPDPTRWEVIGYESCAECKVVEE